MQDICDECGLSPGAVYRYFPSKDDIIESCGLESRQHMQVRWKGLEGVDDTIEVMEKLIQGYLIDALERPEDPIAPALGDWPPSLDIELWAESLHNVRVRGDYLELIAGIVEPLAQLIGRAQERGEIDPGLTRSPSRVCCSAPGWGCSCSGRWTRPSAARGTPMPSAPPSTARCGAGRVASRGRAGLHRPTERRAMLYDLSRAPVVELRLGARCHLFEAPREGSLFRSSSGGRSGRSRTNRMSTR